MVEIKQTTLPQRKKLIKELRESGQRLYKHQLRFQQKLQKFDVFSVGIEFPCYRLSNGRTKDAQLEVIAEKNYPEDFFSADPDSEQALNEQDLILRQMLNEANLLDVFKRTEQDQPLILDNSGYVVNGNRRLCAMRLLLKEDEKKYSHFKHVEVIFLPPCSDRDIKELEGQLQVQPDIRAEYSWTSEAMLFRDWRNQGWTDKQIADLYEKKPKDVTDIISMLEDAENYLESRDKKGRYSFVKKNEYAFKQLQKFRQKCGDNESRKQLLTKIVYILLDRAESISERLYNVIPEAYKYLDSIAEELKTEFKEQIPDEQKESDDLDILGPSQNDTYQGINDVIDDPQNSSEIKEITLETIEFRRNQEKEEKDAKYCFRQIQQAHTKLQSALNAIDENTNFSGIEENLINIENAVKELWDWIRNGYNPD
jgi:hypothetical protein